MKEIIINSGKALLFDNDEEFEDFAVANYAYIECPENGHPRIMPGGYSEMYQKCVEEGVKFAFDEDYDSKIERRQCVSKRVPVVGENVRRGQTIMVQLPVTVYCYCEKGNIIYGGDD